MVDFRPLLFANALLVMLLVTAGFARIQSADDLSGAKLPEPAQAVTPLDQAEPTSAQQAQDATARAVAAQADAGLAPQETGKLTTATVAASQTVSDEAKPDDTRDNLLEPIESSGSAPVFDGKHAAPLVDVMSGKAPPVSTTGPAVDLAAKPLTTTTAPEPTQTAVPAPLAEAQPRAKPQVVKPTTGTLVVRSNVSGDTVMINGKAYGSSRLDLALKPGYYTVLVSKSGYTNWRKEVQVALGDKVTLLAELEQIRQVSFDKGIWQNGVVSGEGSYLDANGLRYTGEFLNKKFHGKGTARYADGSVYEGDWIEGNKHGDGTLKAASGDVYIGAFKDDIFNGQGTLTKANGDIYEGQWLDGKLSGKGSLTTRNGLLYVGGFQDGEFHGAGRLTYPDGRYYDGSFSKGKYHGSGTEIFADGKKYIGQFMDGKFHGEGAIYNPNGSSIAATFRYGEPYGEAKLKTPDGEIFTARTSEPGVCYREKSYRATQCPPMAGW